MLLGAAADSVWFPLTGFLRGAISLSPSPTNRASLAGTRWEDSKKLGLKVSEFRLVEEIFGNSTFLKPPVFSLEARLTGFGLARPPRSRPKRGLLLKVGAISTSGSSCRGRLTLFVGSAADERFAKSSGVMATISTPFLVSLVDKIMASAPISRRTFFKASAVFKAVNFWGPIWTPLYRDFSWFGLPDYILLGKSSGWRWEGVRPRPERLLGGKPAWQSWQRSCGFGSRSQSQGVNYWLPSLERP